MKTLTKLSMITLVALVFFACKQEAPEIKTVEVATTDTTADSELSNDLAYAKASFTIEGMTCEMGCAKTIEKRLAKMDGVKMAQVNFEEKTAMVEFDESKLNTDKIEQAVTKVSEVYTVHNMRTVDSFEAKEAKKCAEDCNKECCAEKKTTATKACSKECKKACCA